MQLLYFDADNQTLVRGEAGGDRADLSGDTPSS